MDVDVPDRITVGNIVPEGKVPEIHVPDLSQMGRAQGNFFRSRVDQLRKIVHAYLGLVVNSDHVAQLLQGIEDKEGKKHEGDQVAHLDEALEHKTIERKDQRGPDE